MYCIHARPLALRRSSGVSLVLGALALAALPLLSADAGAQAGTLLSQQKISPLEGGFVGPLSGPDRFGSSVASLGDLDGDGVVDLAVGAPFDNDGGQGHGAVWILFLNTDGTVKAEQKISDTEGGFLGALGFDDRFGFSVAGLGDLDGDTVEDLAVGAIQGDDGGNDTGTVWILFLNTDGTVKAYQRISNSNGGFGGGLADFAWFGSSIAPLDDFDNDGVEDIAVGSHGDSDNGIFRGAVWLLLLNSDGTVKAKTKINDASGELPGTLEDGDEFGWALACLGDVDGDGAADLAVSSVLDDEGGPDFGAVWILLLDINGPVKAAHKITTVSGDFTGTLDQADHFGRSLAGAGDVDGNGVPDLAVGAYNDDDGAENAGAVWVLFLQDDGTVKAHEKISSSAGGFTGSLDEHDGLGASVASLGDLDGAGGADLVFGASKDDDGGADTGALWVAFMEDDTWVNLGCALEGINGDPLLKGTGTLQSLSAGSLDLTGAAADAIAALFVALTEIPTPFKGGIIKPVPAFLQINLVTDAGGEIPLPFLWPDAVPSGVELYFQYIVQDAAGVLGYSISNAVRAKTP
ncbi:MAG: hypothetical protein ACYTG2_08845 [Planctomycetota bacterium]|jgi:hypothetical protein